LAVIVSVKVPVVFDVPEIVAVPSPLFLKLTPLGSVPVLVRDGFGKPVVVTMKANWVLTLSVTADGLVIAGAWLTVRVKFWVAVVPTPLAAAMARGNVPPAVAVPAIVAVPFPLSAKVSPGGTVPDSLMDGTG
jgi:hypothetical protein